MGSKGSIQMGLTRLTDIDMRALAEVSDDRDVHLSVYLPTGSPDQERLNEAFVSSRVRAIRSALAGATEEDFDRTFSMVEDLLFHEPVPGERGRVVFASAPADLLEVHRIAVDPGRLLVLDNSPFILPLAKMMDDYEDYGIVIMDSREARVYIVRSRVIQQVEGSSIDLMNKHKKGGMSQKRFNRLRRGAIDQFIDMVVEDLTRVDAIHAIDQFVIAGPGEEKKRLAESLPKHIRDRVIGMVDVDMDISRGRLLEAGEEVALAQERREEASALEDLRTAVFRDELEALGVEQARDALMQGRVRTLLVLDGLSIQRTVCETCKRIFENSEPMGRCPDCGGPTSVADVVEELYELAERTDADLEIVTDSPFLRSVGGVGAILRY